MPSQTNLLARKLLIKPTVMLETKVFRAYIPQKLQGLVSMIWEHKMDPHTNFQRQTIFPSGCHGLFFRLGKPAVITQAEQYVKEGNPMLEFGFIGGLQTNTISLHFESYHFLGVQLQPAALYALFGLPAKELTNTTLDGSAIFKDMHFIEEQLLGLETFEQRVKLVENWLTRFFQPDPDVAMAVQMEKVLKNLSNTEPVGQLPYEKLLGYSRSQTHRLFMKWFGLSPGIYWRYKKFLKGLETIHFDEASNLTQIAHASGFYDQAHFTRTFKEFTGLLPKTYQKEKSMIPGHILS